MTTPTPRELDAAEIAAIRERYEERQRAKQAWSNVDISDPAYGVALEHWRMMSMRVCMDIAALLAHIAAVDARCRAYEAALTDVDQLISYPEESGCARGDVGCLLDKVRKVAFDALMATSAATDGSARDGNGEAGT